MAALSVIEVDLVCGEDGRKVSSTDIRLEEKGATSVTVRWCCCGEPPLMERQQMTNLAQLQLERRAKRLCPLALTRGRQLWPDLEAPEIYRTGSPSPLASPRTGDHAPARDVLLEGVITADFPKRQKAVERLRR